MQHNKTARALGLILATVALTAAVQAQYAWTGLGANDNWNNTTNWSGGTFPNGSSDTATFDAAAPRQPTFNVGVQFGTLTALGAQNWAWGNSTATVTNNGSFAYGSTGTSSFAPKLVGTGAVTVTAGVLTNSNAANVYTGDTWVKGGVLNVSAAALNRNAASAAGSNATAVLVGDAATGTDAELRFSGLGNRNITVQGGSGLRTIRTTATGTYSGTNLLNKATVYTANTGTFTHSGKMTGTGDVIVAGAGILSIANTNDYTGQTVINAGTLEVVNAMVPRLDTMVYGALGSPSSGNEEILLGATNGSAAATLKFCNVAANIPYTNNRPIRVRAGSSGRATLDVALQGATPYLYAPIVMDKDLYLNVWNYNFTLILSNLLSGVGGLNITLNAVNNNGKAEYVRTDLPAFSGGMTISGGNFPLTWKYPGTLGDDKTVRFGSGAITLDSGSFTFQQNHANTGTRYVLDNAINVTANNGTLYGWGTTAASGDSQTNRFTGPIGLGGVLTIGGPLINARGLNRYEGLTTIGQSGGGRRGFTLWLAASFVKNELLSSVVDGPGPGGNSLRLSTVGPITIAPKGTGHTYAYGTIVDPDQRGLCDVQSASGALGLGNLHVLDGRMLKLNQSFHINTAGGAGVTLHGNQVCLPVLALGANFLPALTATDTVGVLAIDAAAYDSVSSMSALGGQLFLGSLAGGTFTGSTLTPATDSIYRLGGGGGTLSVANGVLTGAGRSLQVGHPTCAGSAATLGATFGNGAGTVILRAANTYDAGTVVNANSTLQGQMQTSGTPFGSTTAGVTLNTGALQVNGTNVAATLAVGPLTVNGRGIVTMNQVSTYVATNALVIDSFGARPATSRWVAVMNGSAATRLGSKERIRVTNDKPAVVNNMVAPYLLTASTAATPDFLTYNTASDAAGEIGFTNASAAYTTCATVGALNGCTDTSIANVTATYAMSQNVTNYGLRVGAFTLSGGYTNTIAGGGLLFFGAGTISAGVSFGNAEGVVYAGGNSTISGKITGTNGLTKVGPSTLTLSGDNTGLTGTITVVQGTLGASAVADASSDANLGAPGNETRLNGGTLYFPAIAAGGLTISRPLRLEQSGGLLDSGASTRVLTWSGPISGPGMLSKIDGGGGNLVLSSPSNTYRGGTALYSATGRTLTVNPNSSLGVGDVMAAGPLHLYGDQNIGGGDTTTGSDDRQARLAISAQGTVTFYSANPSVGSLAGSGTLTLSNAVLTVGGDNSSTIYAGEILQMSTFSGGSLLKTGSGTFTFKGVSKVTGTTTVQQGTFVADGYMAGGITVNSGATLAGAGTVGAVTLDSNATFLPGNTATNAATTNRMTKLAASSLTFNSGATVTINIYGPTNYTQIVSSGPVNVGGATLQVNVLYKPLSTDVFNIVLNGSGSAIGGTFAGAPEGTRLTLGNGYKGTITYLASGGDATSGNDIRLTNIETGTSGTILLFR